MFLTPSDRGLIRIKAPASGGVFFIVLQKVMGWTHEAGQQHCGSSPITSDRSVEARLSNGLRSVGCSVHLQLGSATPPSAANPSEDAAAQRDRSLGDDAQERLAAIQPACAVTISLGQTDLTVAADMGPCPEQLLM